MQQKGFKFLLFTRKLDTSIYLYYIRISFSYYTDANAKCICNKFFKKFQTVKNDNLYNNFL